MTCVTGYLVTPVNLAPVAQLRHALADPVMSRSGTICIWRAWRRASHAALGHYRARSPRCAAVQPENPHSPLRRNPAPRTPITP